MKNYFALIIIIICCSTYYNAFVLFVGIVRIFCEVYCNAMRNHRVKAINLQRDFPLLGEIMKWHIYLNCVYFTPSLHAHARHRCVNQIDSLFTHCCNNKEYILFCALIIKGSKKDFFFGYDDTLCFVEKIIHTFYYKLSIKQKRQQSEILHGIY